MASTFVGGASIHDESFEDEFSDMEGSITDGNQGNMENVFVALLRSVKSTCAYYLSSGDAVVLIFSYIQVHRVSSL